MPKLEQPRCISTPNSHLRFALGKPLPSLQPWGLVLLSILSTGERERQCPISS